MRRQEGAPSGDTHWESYQKFRLTHAEITFLFETELLPFAEVVEIPASAGKKRWCRDPEDDKFIRCAKAGKCARLVCPPPTNRACHVRKPSSRGFSSFREPATMGPDMPSSR